MPDIPERPTVISVLRSSSLFKALTPEEIDELAVVSRMASAKRGETIWLKGDMVDFFALVGTGFIKMVRSFSSGQEATAEIMGPGQIFGLLGVVEGTGCPLSARAASHCWYLKIPKDSITPIYDQSVILKEKLLRRTVVRFRETTDMLAKMSSGRVEERVALVLMMLSESYGEERDDGIAIQVPLTRQDVAEMAGTTVESTIRTMSRWQKEGIIKSDHMVVTILDDDALYAHLKS